ncbi:YfgM family protein [Panacagrimonas sp.]|uniref:YfgM family protein n=1 Tax=Panacagrimonas sp. TaxID=2480088 RepID=UPI003B51A02C
MATHIDDEEDLEKLKTWWKENWIALVGGLAIGFGGIGGWEGYKRWRDAKAEDASQMYEDMRKSVDADRLDDAAEVADALAAKHASSPYAAAAALVLAQRAVRDDRLDQAAERLAWVAEHSGDEPLAGIARLRHARVLLASGKHDAALQVLDAVGDVYAGLREELRGDIHLARGDAASARSAYEKALAATDPSGAGRSLLQQKFENLTVASSAS